MYLEPGALPALNPMEFETVAHTLAQWNLHVRVLHFRRYRADPRHRDYLATVDAWNRMRDGKMEIKYGAFYLLDPKGGSTTCELWAGSTPSSDPEFLMMAAQAHCHPEDHYCKRIGRTKALNDLLHDIREKGVPHVVTARA